MFIIKGLSGFLKTKSSSIEIFLIKGIKLTKKKRVIFKKKKKIYYVRDFYIIKP